MGRSPYVAQPFRTPWSREDDTYHAAPGVSQDHVGSRRISRVRRRGAIKAQSSTRRAATEKIRIGGSRYVSGDYPIQALPPHDDRADGRVLEAEVATNAAVTIPLLASSRTAARGLERQRAGSGHPLAQDASESASCRRRSTRASTRLTRRSRDRGNSGFEVAATYFTPPASAICSTARSRPPTRCTTTSRRNNPPFSGGERDAINCIQLYRVTHDKKHLDLAKHYLDIRGLENSVNRSRHNQSYKPVLEQTRSRRPRRERRDADGVAGSTSACSPGSTDYFDAAQRMWTDAVERKMYVTGGVGTTGNEGFGEPYSLPNISAYAETCAVLMFMTLNHRLFLATRRQQVHRRDGTRHVQQRPRRRVARRAIASSTSTGSRAPATDATRAGSARRSSAARRISCGSWRRCRATSTRRIRKARST